MPGVAVANEAVKLVKGLNVTFVGTGKPIEKKIIGQTPFSYREVPVPGHGTLGRALGMPLTIMATRKLLRRLRADAVVGLGGYGSVAGAIAARSLEIPVFALEQNVAPGRATLLVGYGARKVLVTYDATALAFPCPTRVAVVGNPVREGIGTLTREDAAARMDVDPDKTTLLVLGGSQGAQAINNVAMEVINDVTPPGGGFQVIHQAGALDFNRVKDFYEKNVSAADWRVEAFFTDMAAAYGASDVVVGRSGATTLAELAVAGLPSLLIPYPWAVRDHQWVNARYFAERGAAIALRQADATREKVLEALKGLVCDTECRNRMAKAAGELARPEAAENAAKRIVSSL